jgi:hypothetical protein
MCGILFWVLCKCSEFHVAHTDVNNEYNKIYQFSSSKLWSFIKYNKVHSHIKRATYFDHVDHLQACSCYGKVNLDLKKIYKPTAYDV